MKKKHRDSTSQRNCRMMIIVALFEIDSSIRLLDRGKVDFVQNPILAGYT